MNRRCLVALTALALLVGGLVVVPPADAAAAGALTVRVSDISGSPGDVVALVLRTLSARPIRQGRISVRPKRPRRNRAEEFRAPTPFLDLEGYEVFARGGDAIAVGSLKDDADGQLATLQFSSASSSVNRTDGPLAVLYLRLAERVRPSDDFLLELQADTELLDVDGQPVPLALLDGVLDVTPPRRRDELGVDSVDTEPGDEARFGVQTLEPRALGSGTIVLEYDPAIAEREPRVRLNSKYGSRRFSVDTSVPGRIEVEFTSPAGDFNTLPGEIVSVEIRTPDDLVPGTTVPIRFDRDATVLRDPDGAAIPYRLRNGILRIVADDGDDDGEDDDGEEDDGEDDDGEDDDGEDDDGEDDDGEDDDEGEDDGNDPGDEVDFERTVVTADAATGLIGLDDGTIVLVTPGLQWDPSGDYFSVAEVATALQNGVAVTLKGEGVLNADGVVVASEIRAEEDD